MVCNAYSSLLYLCACGGMADTSGLGPDDLFMRVRISSGAPQSKQPLPSVTCNRLAFCENRNPCFVRACLSERAYDDEVIRENNTLFYEGE